MLEIHAEKHVYGLKVGVGKVRNGGGDLTLRLTWTQFAGKVPLLYYCTVINSPATSATWVNAKPTQRRMHCSIYEAGSKKKKRKKERGKKKKKKKKKKREKKLEKKKKKHTYMYMN